MEFSIIMINKARPFVKWAGGKYKIYDSISKFFPEKIETYCEPFCGGSGIFFHLINEETFGIKKVILNDINFELINVYISIFLNVDKLINELKKHENTEEYFYKMRDLNPEILEFETRASRMIYLNKTCFNGLYRVNQKGKFNVPFGKYNNPAICDEENLKMVSKTLRTKNVTLLNKNFIDLDYSQFTDRDFIYFDPPFQPENEYLPSFTSYTKEGFFEKDQKSLKNLIKNLTKRNVKCALSNSCCPFILDLYKDFNINIIQASRSINCIGTKRGKINEVLITNYKK